MAKRNASESLLRLLKFRLEFGEVYGAWGDKNRVAIIVVPLTGDRKRSWRYTYHRETLLALQASGAVALEEVESIPDWAGTQLNWLGSGLQYCQIMLPGSSPNPGPA